MKRIIPTTILLLMLGLALPALAEDPLPAIESGAADAELGEQNAPLDTPLEQTIATIRQEARAQIYQLADQLATVSPGSAEAREFEAEITQTKVDAEIAILQAIIADAHHVGDGPRMVEAEAALDRLVNPEDYWTPATPVERTVPSGR